MDIIDFSKKKESLKRSGRFKVTIKTIEAKNSLFFKYLIEIEETFREGDWQRRVSRSKYYHGSDPKKEAQRIIDEIKDEEKHTTNTESYYVD
ncbi:MULTISPECIES: hypothetical protein [Lactococcus]|uniref:Phage protein n=1 Tax=Lactococcus muris TaxID=2941330 RepID=A0ABV4DBK4_9LACT